MPENLPSIQTNNVTVTISQGLPASRAKLTLYMLTPTAETPARSRLEAPQVKVLLPEFRLCDHMQERADAYKLLSDTYVNSLPRNTTKTCSKTLTKVLLTVRQF